MRIVGAVLLLSTMMVGIGSNLPTFLDPPSIIIIAGFTFGVLFISGTSIGGMVKAVVSSDSGVDLRAAARGWKLARQASVSGGIVGVIIGIVIMARNMDDMSALGPGIAICILTLLYGVVIGHGFCLPCQHHVESKI